jgi:hypothetical protein
MTAFWDIVRCSLVERTSETSLYFPETTRRYTKTAVMFVKCGVLFEVRTEFLNNI